MGLLFSLRGDSLTPRYAMGGKGFSTFVGGTTANSPPLPVTSADASCFGGWAIAITRPPDDYKEIFYPARKNWPASGKIFSMRIRAAPNFTGTPSSDLQLIRVGPSRGTPTYGGARLVWQDNNLIRIQAQPKSGFSDLFLSASIGISLTSGVFKDYMLTSDGTNWYYSVDGVQLGTGSVGNPSDARYDLDWAVAGQIVLGQYPFNGFINEVNIWDTCEPHVYAARTAWLTCADFDGTLNTGAGAGNILTGASETINGVPVAGTAIAAVAATTKHGVAANDGTGTYRGTDLNTALAADKILSGNSQTQDGSVVAGTAIAAAKATTKIGVAANDGTGEYYAPERWTALDPSRVAKDDVYLVNAEELVGELDNVTNVIGNHELEGQELAGILEATT